MLAADDGDAYALRRGMAYVPQLCPGPKVPSEERPPLHFILLFEGLKWWAHQGSNLGDRRFKNDWI